MKPVHFAGNDYLGLARDPRLAEAMARAAREFGVGATSGRFFLGWTRIHQQLEDELAEFMGTEGACIFPAAYLGGLTYYNTMAGLGFRTVFCDATSHSNQFQGMRAAGLDVRPFKHLDAADLRRQLGESDRDRSGPPIIATDGVYGMSGEVAPMKELAEAAREVGAELFIDDAHGAFALGESGRGSWELCGLEPGEATVLGSMSKALGCGGGFFAGRGALIERLKHGPGASGSTPTPPPLVAACLAALNIVRTEPELRMRMQAHAVQMRQVLAARGIGVASDQTAILGMMLKDEFEAAALAEQFEASGLVIRYAKYPSEPRHNLLRGVARACYTAEDLERFAEVVATLRRADY